ncbi:hypothetical protein VE03_08505 [Pseudogymnoascus sp. 23342-1-I1]|nr:hypothetical protein VE03_08505 [Pseudogymnoascus sp. 23342-1-I1]
MAQSQPTMNCPNCNAEYDASDLQEYRDHIESCVRPGLAESDDDDESAVSQLSSPPASVSGGDSRLPPAYSLTEVEIYPERRELDEDEEPLPEFRMAKITDVEVFGDNLADCEDLPIDEHYRRILNAQQALVEYQDEWMELEKCVKAYRFPNTISIEEELERERGRGRGVPKEVAKPAQKVINPRALPVRNDDPEKWFYTDDFQLMQDRQEASVYGYIVKEGTKDLGRQDPISQRPRRLGQNQRDLRARAPAQKVPLGEAAEESGEENAPLNLVNEALMIEGGRGKREKRPSTRVASESRASTPPAAPRGRPPRKNAKTRLQEIEADPTAGETMVSTEKWVDNVGDAESRRGSSPAVSTGPSTDWSSDEEVPDREYGTKRRRLDTSDFESAKKAKKAKTIAVDASVNSSAADADAIAKEKSIKRSEGAKMGWAKRKAELQQQRKSSTRATSQDDNEGDDGELKNTKVEGDRPKPYPRKYAKKSKKEPVYTTLPDGTIKKEKSAATINMERRWAKKREAEALGLEPPKIGRYKKSELAAMKASQDGQPTASPDDRSEPKLAPKKRKVSAEDEPVGDMRTEHSESAQAMETAAAKRRKKDSGHPDAGENMTLQGGAAGTETYAASSFYGAKPTSGRKAKKAPAEASMHTPGAVHTFHNHQYEGLGHVHQWSPPSQPVQKPMARHVGGKGKKGIKTESHNNNQNNGPSLQPLPSPGDEKVAPEFQNAPSGAETLGIAVTKEAVGRTTRSRSRQATGYTQTSTHITVAPPAKELAAASKDTTVSRHVQTGLVTVNAKPARSIFINGGQEPSEAEAAPFSEPEPEHGVLVRRKTHARRGPVASIKQEVDPDQKRPVRQAKKSPVAPAVPHAKAAPLCEVPNPSKADESIAPGIPQTLVSGASSHENGSFTTPAAAAGEPVEKESGSGSSGRPKRNRHPPNKYQVVPDESPSSAHHMEHRMHTPHESTGRHILPQDAPFIAYETPNASPQRPSTLKQKSGSRSNVQVGYPPASTSHSETPTHTAPTDPDAIAAAKAKEAARAAKSEKMKAITKARWASGEMEAVMARKKANNAAKRAAEAALPSSSGTKPKKGANAPAKAPKDNKRRQTHGGAVEKPRPPPLGKPPYTTGRKMSEYEQFLALTSPSGPGSPLPPRGRRPAALRASQSLALRDTDEESQADDAEQQEDAAQAENPEQAEDPEQDEDEDEFYLEGESDMDSLDLQFAQEYDINAEYPRRHPKHPANLYASEYDHYQALTSPDSTIMLGKRVRRPVGGLKEAMEIEKGGEASDV